MPNNRIDLRSETSHIAGPIMDAAAGTRRVVASITGPTRTRCVVTGPNIFIHLSFWAWSYKFGPIQMKLTVSTQYNSVTLHNNSL